jgi:hypothetical protein
MSDITSMSQTTIKPFNSTQPKASPHKSGATRKHPVLAGVATVFVAAAGIAYWAGQLPVPSLIIAAGAGYLAYMTYLAVAFHNLIKDEVIEATERPKQAVDNWLGAGVGRIRPGSDDASMHLDLGTLSPEQAATTDDK